MAYLRSVYDVTPELLEWLNHTLVPMEEPVFLHYRTLKHLIRIVDRAEAGTLPREAAYSAIRDHNETARTNVTYEEIRDKTPDYVFCDFGQWAAYVDNLHAQLALITGPHDDPNEMLANAPADINWIVLLLPLEETVIVYRSPHVGFRQEASTYVDSVWGLSQGPHKAYTLPPQIEAALGQCDPEEITHQYLPRRDTDARSS